MNSSPWAKLTTSMMPKISVSPEAISARIMPVTMPFTVWIRIWSKGMEERKSIATSLPIRVDRGTAARIRRAVCAAPPHPEERPQGASRRMRWPGSCLLPSFETPAAAQRRQAPQDEGGETARRAARFWLYYATRLHPQILLNHVVADL